MKNHAKREGRIAPSRHGRSASPMTGCTYSVRALRNVIHGKFLTGSIISASAFQTKNIARALSWALVGAQPKKRAYVFALQGELGSGKTTFVQGFAKGLGVAERVLSPTFIIMKKFALSFDRAPSRMTGRNPKFEYFYHIDCYRLDDPIKELLQLGFKNIIQDPRNIVVIEWADRIKKILSKDAFWIQFKHGEKNKRSIAVSS